MRTPSHEVRWVFAGELLLDVEEWFRARVPLATGWPAEWREDTYLRLPGTLDLGVKRRGGGDDARLEVKGRTAQLGLHSFGARAAGRVERWLKWSLAPDALTGPLATALDPERGGALVLAKKGLLALRVLGREGALEPVRADEPPPPRTLELELSRLRLADLSAWTLAFEASSHDQDLHDDFDLAVAGLVEDCPVELEPARSVAYPEWFTWIEESSA